ncbi:CASP-like protein [Hibiscus syriacus]|uniref:CASP-like protein n=1 Tax=Hibiscus syriacus TaxID=106335 RepID=A0A6A2X115_HIBSY|nr:CASP-like protein [Hibiscus syriacus]
MCVIAAVGGPSPEVNTVAPNSVHPKPEWTAGGIVLLIGKHSERTHGENFRKTLYEPDSEIVQLVSSVQSCKSVQDGNDRVKRAFQTLLIYVRNVVKSPDEEKFRKIRLGNPKFQERVGILKEGLSFSSFADSREVKGTSSWFFSDKVDIRLLNYAGSLLNSAMTNPFFGLLEKVKED